MRKYITNAVESLTYSNIGRTLSYHYDGAGNISRVVDSQNDTAEQTDYLYDGLNQLIRVNDSAAGKTTTYTYDAGGNILTKRRYSYTTGSLDGLTGTVVQYTYGNENWKDLLTAYNGNAITYDAIGNPLTYYNGTTFTWDAGRQLSTATKADGTELSFKYNDSGIRTSKTVGGVTTEYFLDGTSVIAEKTGNNILWFYYDGDGSREAVEYNGGVYYYLYNAQGDVLGLFDNNLNVVVNYTYDSWGNLLSVTGSMANTLGQANPFRYRGYYYDTETGLYYLNSRYYDPETGRFINADGYTSTGQDINGNNMFVYCGNNPVNRSDPSGMFWKEIGNFFKKVGTAIADFAKATFGAGSSTSVTITKTEVQYLPDPLPITAKSGTKTTQTISKHGNSSKPVSVYAKCNANHPIKSSSAGIKFNISSFTLDISVGLDNIGISGSLEKGNTTDSFGLKVNLSELKVGLEGSSAIKWDNTTETTYTNISVSGWAIAAAYVFATTGQPMLSPSYAYGN